MKIINTFTLNSFSADQINSMGESKKFKINDREKPRSKINLGGGEGVKDVGVFGTFFPQRAVLLSFLSPPPLTLLASRVPYHSHNSRIQYNGHCVVY